MAESRERIRAPVRDGREFLTSSRQVLRRLMLLSEGRQYREAASIVGRIKNPTVLRSIVSEIPIDLLLEHLPHSTHLLETFFSRLVSVGPIPKPSVPIESIIWHLVRLFANSQCHEPNMRHRCMNLVNALVEYEPSAREILQECTKNFNNAVQGLGVHGLINDHTSGSHLISVYNALKTEIQLHIDTYKIAINKLEELSPITVNQDPALSSHQRLLAINYGDIQQRLIDNKTILTILDKPSLKQLHSLIENLNQRVENDKEVIKCVSQVKRWDSQANVDRLPAAGILMNFSRGCETVLDLMGPECLATRSSSSSDGYHSDDSVVDETKNLVTQYRSVYIEERTDALEALDSLPQLKDVPTLKSKILFSIIVVSFRLCHSLRERKVLEVRRILGCQLESANEVTLALDRSVRSHLQNTIDTFPLGDIERSVFSQVLSTLHEYPCLETVPGLLRFVSCCVRLSWRLVNQMPPFYLDNDFSLGFLRPEKHERHPLSDRRSDLIKAFLWPALMKKDQCVYKAIVST